MLDQVQYAFMGASYVGIIAFSISGVLVGVRKNLDLVAVFLTAMVASHGGGLLRDVLMNRMPTVLTDPTGFYIVCAVMLLIKLLGLKRLSTIENKMWFVISDSIGLVAFGITGSLVALHGGLHFFGVMVMAFLTAVGGGLLRDVLVNEFPKIFESEFYGSTAIISGAILYAMYYFYTINDMIVFCCLIFGLLLRMVAFRYNWHIPRLTQD